MTQTETVAPGTAAQATSLAARLAKARRSAKTVTKEGRNEAQGYDYVRAEDVIREAQRVLNRNKITVEPEITDVNMIEVKTARGAPAMIALVKLTFHITDAETGETFTRDWAGTGWDSPGDKALYKALTGGTKYLLAALLGIPFGEDPEDDESGGNGNKVAAPHRMPDTPIDPDQVSRIGKGISALALSYEAIDMILGACGADGLRAKSAKALKERVETLTPDVAARVEDELNRRAEIDAQDASASG